MPKIFGNCYKVESLHLYINLGSLHKSPKERKDSCLVEVTLPGFVNDNTPWN